MRSLSGFVRHCLGYVGPERSTTSWKALVGRHSVSWSHLDVNVTRLYLEHVMQLLCNGQDDKRDSAMHMTADRSKRPRASLCQSRTRQVAAHALDILQITIMVKRRSKSTIANDVSSRCISQSPAQGKHEDSEGPGRK